MNSNEFANFQILNLDDFPKKSTLDTNKCYTSKELKQDFPSQAPASQNNTHGYLIKSTASINVDTKQENVQWSEVRKEIIKIAQNFVSGSEKKDLNLTIFVHGYANSEKDAIERSLKINKYLQDNNKYLQDNNVNPNKKQLFLGYRWPAENLFMGESNNQWCNLFKNLEYAFQSLPTLLKGILGFSIGSILVYLINLFTINKQWFDLALLIGAGLFSIVLTFIGLRLSSYFRDRDRASNYAVLDLVDFLRKIDLAIFNEYFIEAFESHPNFNKNQVDLYRNGEGKYNVELNLIGNLGIDSEKINKFTLKEENKIVLNFIAHSMGAFIVTNVIRILSDVFDPKSIDPISIDDNMSYSDIGKTFTLGRLVLLAPDIPVETIISRRANFLAPSLRRCKEAYIFSSEGDLALRLASTAANYISFPAKTNFSGYKLGNITVKHFAKKGSKILSSLYSRNENSKKYQPLYGFVNDQTLPPLQYLEIRASDKEHRNFQEEPFILNTQQEQTGGLASHKVTYFDCTDYIDKKGNPRIIAYEPDYALKKEAKGILTYALKKEALNLPDYVLLLIAYIRSKINTHGGYFEGEFIQKLIYDLAFLGIEDVQTSFDLDGLCKTHQIQVLLSTSNSQQT